MSFVFKKLTARDIVASIGKKVFRKLSTDIPPVDPPAPPPITGFEPENFNLNILGLETGTYTIVVKSRAAGLIDSDFSASVEYIVK